MKRWLGVAIFTLTLALSLEATPSFSRKYQLNCNTCHTVVPALNEYGRRFQFNGNTLEEGLEVAVKSLRMEGVNIDYSFPLSIRMEAYPLLWYRNAHNNDTSSSSYGSFEIPALISLYSHSRFSPYSSGKIRLVLAPNMENEYNLEIDQLSFDVHVFGYDSPLNFRVGIQSPFYFFENSSLRLTRAEYGLFEIKFPQGGDEDFVCFKSKRPGFFAYGFPNDLLFYDVGIYLKEKQFGKPDFYGRMGITPMPELFLSGFGYFGWSRMAGNKYRKYLYYGGEISYSSSPYFLNVLILSGKEDLNSGRGLDLLGGFVEGGLLRDNWVLGIRYDFQTSSDFTKLKQLTSFLSVNIIPNVVVGIEYSASTDDLNRGEISSRIEFSY